MICNFCYYSFQPAHLPAQPVVEKLILVVLQNVLPATMDTTLTQMLAPVSLELQHFNKSLTVFEVIS